MLNFIGNENDTHMIKARKHTHTNLPRSNFEFNDTVQMLLIYMFTVGLIQIF